MPSPDLMIVLGVVATVIAAFFFIRFPRYRWHIAGGAVLAGGLAVFLTWYLLFRIDDATFVADKAAAEQQQQQLDKLFDEPAGPVAAAAPAPVPAPAAAEQAAEPPPAPKLVGGREMPLTPTAPGALGTLPDGVGVPVGQIAPDVVFTGLDGTPVKLSSLTASGRLVLVFYRGGWCPFCNAQVHAFAQGYARLQALGLSVAFASVDTPEGSAVTRASWTVPFPLLSDPDAAAHEAFRVVNPLSAADYERLVGFGLDIEAWSGRKHHKIAVPAIFLLDRDRTVLWAHAAHDYKVRPTLDLLIPALEAALARTP